MRLPAFFGIAFAVALLAVGSAMVALCADEAAPDEGVVRFLRAELAPETEAAPAEEAPASPDEEQQESESAPAAGAPVKEDAAASPGETEEQEQPDGDSAGLVGEDEAQDVSAGLAVLEGEEPPPPEEEKMPKSPAEPGRFFGPLPGRNQHPLYVLFFNFPAERARTLKPGSSEFAFRFDAANTIIKNTEGGALTDLDLESWEYKLEYRRGTDTGEFTLVVPVRVNAHGIMDNIIYTWHGWFGLKQGDRPFYPENDFRYFVRTRDGTMLNFPSDEPGFGDVSVQWKHELGRSHPTHAWAVRVGVKLPTGDSGTGLGSGDFDLGMGVAYESLGARWARYANLNYIVIGGSDFPGLDAGGILTGMVGAEYRLKPTWRLTGQLDFSQCPFRTGSPWVDRDSLELLLGFHKLLSQGVVFSGGFSEDVLEETASDFAVMGELRWLF